MRQAGESVSNGHPSENSEPQALCPRHERFWYGVWAAITGGVVLVLAVVQARARQAPVVMADNAVIFLAADRWYAGLGFTAPVPLVPAQRWDWQGDWTILTQWPMGYPLLLCTARKLLGVSTVRAATVLSVLSCGVALVGWFVWVRRCLPRSLPSGLIALLAAGSTFSMNNLINPSSDTVLTALVPLVLLGVWWALGWHGSAQGGPSVRSYRLGRSLALPGWHGSAQGGVPLLSGPWHRATLRVALLGFVAGTLVWIRYAAVFVPLGIGAFLVIEGPWARPVRGRQVLMYALSAAVPILTLGVINRVLGDHLPVQQRYPVGDRLTLAFDWDLWVVAWHQFTRQTFYAHRPEAEWSFAALLPLGGLFLPLAWRASRRAMRSFWASPPVRLGLVLTVTCLLMLVGLSAVFGSRFNYAGLDRYYLPIRPFYFLFFVGPVAAFPPRVLRVLACVPLLMAGSWLVRQDWVRSYQRLTAQAGEVTPYGRRAVHFEPNSSFLYEWLRAQASDDLLVLSNFHDDIALETWIPACPTPRDPAELRQWIERVKRARGVTDVRVLFVLDPDNHGREYFLPPPEELVRRFELVRVPGIPERIASYVYTVEPR